MLFDLTSDFDSFFADVLDILYGKISLELELSKSHFIRVAKYNVPNGKKLRGRCCVAAFKCFSNVKHSADHLRLANLVGWAVELLQAGFLVHDDLIDGSPMRRGQTSWGLLQQREGHGLIGINDGLHLFMSVQQLLLATLYAHRHPRYLEILKLFCDCANFTCFGQALDILLNEQLGPTHPRGTMSPLLVESNDNRLSAVTMSRFASVAKWKTTYYSFILPITAGMLLADVKSDVLFSNAKSILLQIGEYFQAQDDFLDVYGDEDITGKMGTDIAEGKCSWPIATALEKVSDERQAILNSNYGRKDPTCVAAVRKIFDEIHMPDLYSAYEARTRKRILEFIDSVSTDKECEDFTDAAATKLPRNFFVELLNTLYLRKK